MTQTMHVSTTVGTDRYVRIQLPDATPEGDVDLFVVAVSDAKPSASKIGDLLGSDIIGMWADRTDTGDSAQFARNLRERAWRRTS